MKRDIIETIEIPKNIEVVIEKNLICIKSDGRELRKSYKRFAIRRQDDKLVLEAKKAGKKEKKLVKTMLAHIKNMIRGLGENFVYKLQICSVHFPINVSFDESSREILIKNFLGETIPRKAKILPGVDVKIEKDFIILESYDKEAAGQTAANIEKATKIKRKDRRIFQDGIWIVSKAGKEIK